MSMANGLRNKIVDLVLRGQAYSPPATLYIALCTTSPTASTPGTEVAVAGYSRTAYVCSLANWSGTQGAGTTTASTGTTGASSNNNDIGFTTPTVDVSSAVSHWMAMDASTGGNMLFYGTIVNGSGVPTPRTVHAGDALVFVAGALQIQTT